MIFLGYFSLIQVTSSQSGFSLLISTPLDEKVFDAIEDDNGTYSMVGLRSNFQPFEQNAYLLSIDNFGEVTFEQVFSIDDTISYFGCINYQNDTITIFGAKGSIATNTIDNLWILMQDEYHNVIQEKTFDLFGYNLADMSLIKNSRGNFVINGVVSFPDEMPDMLFYEISPQLDSINCSILSFQSGQFGYDFIELKSGGYKVFAGGYFPGGGQYNGTIVEVDSVFNFLGTDSIPYGLIFNHSADWLNDSVYLVTGNKGIYKSPRVDIGIAMVKDDDLLINGNHFGKLDDTISYVGAIKNLDFISRTNIYFGGASNIYPTHLPYQPEDSWLILVNLDSNMNKNWQRFYGGDAFYYLWGLKATSDEGCLMLATRYDDITQDNEFDIFIVKVDSNGLITSVPDIPSLAYDEILFFPNPAGAHVTAQFPGAVHQKEKTLEIYNNMGILFRQFDVPENQDRMQIDVSPLTNGLYYGVMCSKGRRVAAGKMIIARYSKDVVDDAGGKPGMKSRGTNAANTNKSPRRGRLKGDGIAF
jgi:hypothetical protein